MWNARQLRCLEVAASWAVLAGCVSVAMGQASFRGLSAPSPYTDSTAVGVSADGSVVVGYQLVNWYTPGGAFIWDAHHGMRNLQDLLTNDLYLDLTGWQLRSAGDISADGLTIVGYGLHNGVTEAFVAVIPEPATLSPLALGGLAVIRRRRRTTMGAAAKSGSATPWRSKAPWMAPVGLWVLLGLLSPAAACILNDCFTAPNGTNLVGRRPEGGIPREPYVAVGEVQPGDATIQSNQAHIASGTGVASRIGTTKHTWFWCNVEVTMGDSEFVGLGFYSQPGANVLDNFSGWILTRSGDLLMYMDGVYTGEGYQGDGFDPYVPCPLGTWDYIDIGEQKFWPEEVQVWGGTSARSFDITGFTQANTEYAGILVGPSLGKTYGDFDNLTVWWMPEPASMALLALGSIGMLLRRRGLRR